MLAYTLSIGKYHALSLLLNLFQVLLLTKHLSDIAVFLKKIICSSSYSIVIKIFIVSWNIKLHSTLTTSKFIFNSSQKIPIAAILLSIASATKAVYSIGQDEIFSSMIPLSATTTI